MLKQFGWMYKISYLIHLPEPSEGLNIGGARIIGWTKSAPPPLAVIGFTDLTKSGGASANAAKMHIMQLLLEHVLGICTNTSKNCQMWRFVDKFVNVNNHTYQFLKCVVMLLVHIWYCIWINCHQEIYGKIQGIQTSKKSANKY